jgi:hypothetical protein
MSGSSMGSDCMNTHEFAKAEMKLFRSQAINDVLYEFTHSRMLVMSSQRSLLWGQVNKCMWWMPWRLQATKDVQACEKLRGVGNETLIRRCPNGETRPARVIAF